MPDHLLLFTIIVIIVSVLLGTILLLAFVAIIVYVIYALVDNDAVKKRLAKLKAAKAFGYVNRSIMSCLNLMLNVL